jgi:hypothetical protein
MHSEGVWEGCVFFSPYQVRGHFLCNVRRLLKLIQIGISHVHYALLFLPTITLTLTTT